MIIWTAVKFGWKALSDVLNKIGMMLDERTPREGPGIKINQGPGGFEIRVDATNPTGLAATAASDATSGGSGTGSTGTGSGSGGGGGDGTTPIGTLTPTAGPAGWNLVNIVIETSTGYQMRQMWTWGAVIPL